MVLMLQTERSNDYLIAFGTTISLKQFAHEAFAVADLDLADHLESVEALNRPAGLNYSAINPRGSIRSSGGPPVGQFERLS